MLNAERVNTFIMVTIGAEDVHYLIDIFINLTFLKIFDIIKI